MILLPVWLCWWCILIALARRWLIRPPGISPRLGRGCSTGRTRRRFFGSFDLAYNYKKINNIFERRINTLTLTEFLWNNLDYQLDGCYTVYNLIDLALMLNRKRYKVSVRVQFFEHGWQVLLVMGRLYERWFLWGVSKDVREFPVKIWCSNWD